MRNSVIAKAMFVSVSLSQFALLQGCEKTIEITSPDTPVLSPNPNAVGPVQRPVSPNPPVTTLGPVRHLTILGTNDVHGSVAPQRDRQGAKLGGLAFFSGVVKAIRDGVNTRHGKSGGVLLLDGGDQFQGTLVSNFTEGKVVFEAFDQIGYDAIVPGNHDYDFGPEGWLDDKVTPTTRDQNPRGVIEGLARSVKFPLLASNVYETASLVDLAGKPVTVGSSGCKPRTAGAQIDWSKAKRPGFLREYMIKEVAGVRVAVIGMDNPGTGTTTTPENVSDLCFRGIKEQYLDTRQALDSAADVFVLVMHDGDSGDKGASRMVREILAARADAVHAVVAGHTHFVNHEDLGGGVKFIQSGANGEMFGRIELVWDTVERKILASDVKSTAGVTLYHESCAKNAIACAAPKAQGDLVSFDEESVKIDSRVESRVAQVQAEVDAMAKRKLGVAQAEIKRDRTSESALANMLTDLLREGTGAELSFMNTGGIRTNIAAGDVTYEALYEVLPFNNRGLVIGPMPLAKILGLLERSIKTCGSFGALMQSGLRVKFSRDCSQANGTTDEKAKLLSVETLKGEKLFDVTDPALVPVKTVFEVATLDFLSAGGSGFDGFKGVPVKKDLGIAREIMVDRLLVAPGSWDGKADGRWLNVK